MKFKITNNLKPPLTKNPFAVSYRAQYEMSDWKWWVSETKKKTYICYLRWVLWSSEVKQNLYSGLNTGKYGAEKFRKGVIKNQKLNYTEYTAWKMPMFRVYLVCILHSDWIWIRKTLNRYTFYIVNVFNSNNTKIHKHLVYVFTKQFPGQFSKFIPSENTKKLRFSGVFRGYKIGTLAWTPIYPLGNYSEKKQQNVLKLSWIFFACAKTNIMHPWNKL